MSLEFNLLSCEPASYLKNGHAQTIVAHLTSPKSYMIPQDRFRVSLEGNDYLQGHYFQGTNDYVICSFHGLSGDWTSDYMQYVAEMGLKNSCHVILWNHRGAGEAPMSKKPYNSGSVEDVGEALSYTRKKFPSKKIILVGFSLSGNIALAMAGGYKKQEPADITISINAPIDLLDSSLRLKNGVNRLYDLRFVKRLSAMVKDQVSVPKFASLWDFDEIYTAPASGFKNREHYYSECSSIQYLGNIQTPTIMLTAEDDPFVSIHNYRKIPVNPYIYFHAEKHGGHMGYLSRNLKNYQYRWLKYYLDQIFQQSVQGTFLKGGNV